VHAARLATRVASMHSARAAYTSTHPDSASSSTMRIENVAFLLRAHPNDRTRRGACADRAPPRQ
jgi:hypothetical protein